MGKATHKRRPRKQSVDGITQQRTWRIWQYVTENRMSLDSGRACEVIAKEMVAAIASVRDHLKECEKANKKLQREVSELNKTIRSLKSENEELRETNEQLQRMGTTPSDEHNRAV